MIYGLRYKCKICKDSMHCFEYKTEDARVRAVTHALDVGSVSSIIEVELFEYPHNRRKSNACLQS